MQVSFCDVGGINTRYYHAGSGDNAVLLVHGYGASADNWCRVIDPFASAGYAVYAPDILGHGFTDWRDTGSEPPQLAIVRHLGAFMDKVGIKTCAAAGSSLGGVLVPLLYFARPKQVTKLVCVGIHTPVTDTGTLDPAVIRAANANGSKAMQIGTWDACTNRLANICFRRESSPKDVALLNVTCYALPDRLTAYNKIGEGIAAAVNDDRVRINPKKIMVPTLMLSGRQDIRAPVDIIEKNYRRLPKGEIAVFEECGHLPEIEHPEKFMKTVLPFFKK
ncbi:MAG: alpha/beta hydrolase [Alphaproteobacteria bacterium]|nr:alpha/beta hydrolase [Alphaproteobacteria bacterium]